MGKDPAFLFYSSDFLTGVSFLNFEERGKYITILCQMHQHGRLSEESICFSVGLVSVNLKSKFSIDENGLWFHKRLEEETEKRNRFTESRRINGLRGGRGNQKKASGKASAKHKVKHMGNHMEDENDNENKDINRIEIILPYDSENFKNAWNLLLTTPKWKKKKPLALQASLKKLSDVPEIDAIKMIENTIAGDWQGLFPLKGSEVSKQKESPLKGTINAMNEVLEKINNGSI